MAQVYKDAQGNYVAVRQDGTQVPVLPGEIKNGSIGGFSPVLQQQGVTMGQRWKVKNVSNTPDIARSYLDSVGYEVRPYGSGFNFAVRPKGSGNRVPWKVVDPDGFDPQDILDLTSDAVSLGAQGVAGALVSPSLETGEPGMAAEAAATGGAAAAVDAGKQALGIAMGVPNNLDPTSVAAAGAGGAASVPIGRAVSAATRGVAAALGRTARSVGARFAGIEGSRALPGADAVRDAAEWSISNPGQLMKSPEQAAEIVRKAIRTIAANPFPERDAAMGMAKEAAAKGGTLNIRPTMEAIQDEMMMPIDYRSPAWGEAADMLAEPIPQLGQTPIARTPELQVKHAGEETLQANLEKVMATMHALVRDDTPDALPLDRAVLLKNYLQQIARQKGAYTQTPPGRAFRDIVTKQAQRLRQDVESAMTNAGYGNYVPTMRAFERKTGLLHDWSKVMRVKDGSAAAAEHRANVVRTLFSDAKTNWLSALGDLESTFGLKGLKGVVREAAVGRVTGMAQEGGPSLLGRGTRSTLGLGALVFGHPAVAGVELAATSPKVLMAGTKLGMRAAPGAAAATKATAKAAALVTMHEAAQAVGKGISRDDHSRPRKPTRIGI